jgi:two-component system OmpR family sensor kinase
MSLRTRLVASLAVVLALALVLAGVLILGLTRAGLVERLDRELLAIAGATSRMEQLAQLADADSEAGRRLAVLRLDRRGNVARAFPSGFASDPDPLPALPEFPGGIPDAALGVVTQRPSVDGSMQYRVLLERGPRDLVTIAVAVPMTSIEAADRALVQTMLLVGGVAMGALVLVAWFVIRQGLLPLERMTRTAEEIAGGNLAHRAGVPHDGTEVGRLGTAFDSMLDQIERSFAEQRAALEAKEGSEARLRRFAADASHELRTPLTVVRGYADLHRAGGLADPEALATAMERIGTESRRMAALVEDLLLLARLDQGRPIRHDPVDLSRIADDAVADLRAIDPERPVVAEVERGVTLTGDDDRLRQVVANLIANVRVHAGPRVPLELLVRTVDGEAELRVVDHGPGIDPEHAARVFDRFYRADPGRGREHGGTGLGLSIVASLVAAHGGFIRYEPTLGGGATFVVRLPLTADSQPTPGGRTVTAPTL